MGGFYKWGVGFIIQILKPGLPRTPTVTLTVTPCSPSGEPGGMWKAMVVHCTPVFCVARSESALQHPPLRPRNSPCFQGCCPGVPARGLYRPSAPSIENPIARVFHRQTFLTICFLQLEMMIADLPAEFESCPQKTVAAALATIGLLSKFEVVLLPKRGSTGVGSAAPSHPGACFPLLAHLCRFPRTTPIFGTKDRP